MRRALARRTTLDLLSGARRERAAGIARYLLAGRLRGLDGIYVESSTSLAGPADLVLLAIARLWRIPVVTFIRDAYQLYPEYYPITSLRRRLARAAFVPVTRWLARLSTVAAFPSRGLARVVLGDGDRAEAAALLPPGARVADVPAVDPAARALLYVGSLAQPVSGGALLTEALALARSRGHDLGLICVVPPGQGPEQAPASGIEVIHASAGEIERLIPRVLATVTPRRRTAYNDLAVPVKVMEYLGYRRPMIVTDATETAAIVRRAGCGLVVADTAEALADGMATVAEAPPEQLLAWGEAAGRAAAANAWESRADEVLALLGVQP
jgi:glycosyltransferase involved in cell wall biosynthesis